MKLLKLSLPIKDVPKDWPVYFPCNYAENVKRKLDDGTFQVYVEPGKVNSATVNGEMVVDVVRSPQDILELVQELVFADAID